MLDAVLISGKGAYQIFWGFITTTVFKNDQKQENILNNAVSKLEPQGALIAHLSTMSTSVIS